MIEHTITINIDTRDWPYLQGTIERTGGNSRILPRTSYDIAASQFTPAVTGALQDAITQLTKHHKGD